MQWKQLLKFQDPVKRLIYITIEQVKHFVRIRIENTVAEVPAFDHGIPLTTIKSIKKIMDLE